ncbi:hypothetical protein QTI08_10515 [Variovorax sp. J22G40]|nr:hypothetical protein [Variovorax sp. J22G40]
MRERTSERRGRGDGAEDAKEVEEGKSSFWLSSAKPLHLLRPVVRSRCQDDALDASITRGHGVDPAWPGALISRFFPPLSITHEIRKL